MNPNNRRCYYYIYNPAPSTSEGGTSISFYEDLIELYIDTHPNFNYYSSSGTTLVDKIYNANLQGFMNYEQNARRRFYFSENSPYSSLYMATIPYHNEFEPMYALHRTVAGSGSDVYNESPNGMFRIYPTHSSFYQEANNTAPRTHGVRPNIGAGLCHGIRTYINNVI